MDFPDGPVIKNPPCKAGDAGDAGSLGSLVKEVQSHMPQGN